MVILRNHLNFWSKYSTKWRSLYSRQSTGHVSETLLCGGITYECSVCLGKSVLFWTLSYKTTMRSTNLTLICLSTSGNSKNVINAAALARMRGIRVFFSQVKKTEFYPKFRTSAHRHPRPAQLKSRNTICPFPIRSAPYWNGRSLHNLRFLRNL